MSSPATTPGTSSGYTVTNQNETTDLINSKPVRGVRIYFTTGLGNEGSVFIPDAQYQPGPVQAALSMRAALLDTIGTLTTVTPGS